MQTPLQVEIEGFRPPALLQGIVETHVVKLDRQFAGITAARVTIRAPDSHHRMGEPFKVTIQLLLRGRREVNVKPPHALDRRQADVIFAVNDAFRRAARQMRDLAARMKKRTRHPARSGDGD